MTEDSTDGAKPTVRPKASHRKQRAANIERVRLQPVQQRSRERNVVILAAASKLLETVNIENLSHSDVAAVAGISKASVHYHFPSIASIQLALGRGFNAELSAYVASRNTESHGGSWQELVRQTASVARDWFGFNRPGCEALLGPLMTRENRLAGMQYNEQTGSEILRQIRKYYVVPEMPHLEGAFAYNGEIIDLFWSRSYLRSGMIDDEALEESLRASLGYLRNFLPDFLPKRSKK